MERNDYLIKKKFYAYLIPGVMMVAALQLGNLLDSVFVGNILGMTALSASSLGMPVVFLAQVPMMIFAIGGSTAAGVYIGRRETGKASMVFRIAILSTLFLSIAIALASLLFVPAVARSLTPDTQMAEMCGTFTQLYLIGLVPMGAAYVMGSFMAVDNHPKESSAMHIVANVINLVLDYIFLAILKTGIAGSVWSTIIGYTVSGLIFSVIYLRSKKRMIRIRIPDRCERSGLFGETVKTGAASGMLTLLNAVRIIVLNSAVIHITGNAGMAVYAVSVNSMFLVQLCLHGIVGVIPTMSGILFGDKDYYGIRRLLKRANSLLLIVSLALTAFFLITPGLVGGMFGYDAAAGGQDLVACIRLLALSFVFYAFNMAAQSYYPAVQKSKYATLNTALQGFVLLIPFTLLLLGPMGVAGTGLASALTESLALLIVVVLIRILQKNGKEEGTDLTLLPAAGSDALDITVKGTPEGAAGIAHRIVEYCSERGIERRTANVVAFAAEELVHNIASYSGQDERISFIDIMLTEVQGTLVLRVRDNGVFFDPLAYIRNTSVPEGELDPGGLRMILSMAKKVDYSRVLEMNNTVVEVAVDADTPPDSKADE